jgi:hypothetical protein
VNDPGRLIELGKNADRTREARSIPQTAKAFVEAWTEMLDGSPHVA